MVHSALADPLPWLLPAHTEQGLINLGQSGKEEEGMTVMLAPTYRALCSQLNLKEPSLY